jgi:hypothetical protein
MSKAPQIDDFVAHWKYTGGSEHVRLEEFWSVLTESSHYHVQDLTGTNAVFGGDLFPSDHRFYPQMRIIWLVRGLLSERGP